MPDNQEHKQEPDEKEPQATGSDDAERKDEEINDPLTRSSARAPRKSWQPERPA